MARTVIIYHENGTKTVLKDTKIAVGSDKGDERREKVNFHRNMLAAHEQAENNGARFTRREAELAKRAHGAAAECGGDLPPFGTTRLGI